MSFSVEPTSLIMRDNRCAYCNNESVSDYGEIYLFGISHCHEHVLAARRDYNAYLHKNNHVTLYDAFTNIHLRPLLTFLENNDVHVSRTNGIIENNWRLRKANFADFIRISKINNMWCVPMIHNNHITKNVPIISFLNPEILISNAAVFPLNFVQMIQDALTILDAGIYINFYQEYAILNNGPIPIEPCGVVVYNTPVGPVRVFEPSLTV